MLYGNVIIILKDLFSSDLKYTQCLSIFSIILLLMLVGDKNSATSTFVETNKKEMVRSKLN